MIASWVPQVGKNKRISKGKKGGKKKAQDPFARKDWYDVKAPSMFTQRSVGKTLVTRTTGTKVGTSFSIRGIESSCSKPCWVHNISIYLPGSYLATLFKSSDLNAYCRLLEDKLSNLECKPIHLCNSESLMSPAS